MRAIVRDYELRLRRAWTVMALALAWACMPATAGTDNPRVIVDAAGDIAIRRTDSENDGPLNPGNTQMPDLLEIRVGTFTPVAPSVNPFDGEWDVAGIFVRVDIMFSGLVNPPGPVNWDDDWPVYSPFLYGPNPVSGYLEFDLDASVETGGELEYPEYRYLGHVARFGGVPQGAEFINHVAIDRTAFDTSFATAPWCDRSGEEFHLMFRAEETDDIHVLVEQPGGDPNLFESGERWRLHGDYFHRAHGFEEFAFSCQDEPGRYKPEVDLQFSHDPAPDVTTVSLVYPLTNAGSAALISPSRPVQPNDGCEDNQNSIEEALIDLRWSAINASPWDQSQPEFPLIAGWATRTVSDHLDPTAWRVTAIFGTSYLTQQSGSDRYVWTDIWPNVVAGDFDGDGQHGPADVALFESYVAGADGNPQLDDDGVNGSIAIHYFARSAILYDVNYDGTVDSNDLPGGVLPGDMDLNGVLDVDDADDFVLGLLDPGQYMSTHDGEDPRVRGDLNGDALLDGGDVPLFVELLIE